MCLLDTTVNHPGDCPHERQHRAMTRTLTGTRHSGDFLFCFVLYSFGIYVSVSLCMSWIQSVYARGRYVTSLYGTSVLLTLQGSA